MNRVRILRLTGQNRIQYIQTELSQMKGNQLRHIAAHYGVKNTPMMGKQQMVDILTDGLLKWAEREEYRMPYE